MTNLILNLTPTGMVPTKAMNGDVPIWPGEIVADVLGCAKTGITMVHLHARDEEGRPAWRKDIYAEIIKGIRKVAPDLVICVSLSGRDVPEFEKRADVLSLMGGLKPDMGSLTLSSLNFPTQASVNSPDMVKLLAADMLKRGIVPELEIFDLGMVNYANYLVEKGLVPYDCYANVFLGSIAGAQLDLVHAGALLHGLPVKCLWSLGGIGAAQFPANLLGIAMGGGVRVGLEDSLWMDPERKVAATNFAMVERIHVAARLAGREIMTPAEFRSLMGMAKVEKEAGHGPEAARDLVQKNRATDQNGHLGTRVEIGYESLVSDVGRADRKGCVKGFWIGMLSMGIGMPIAWLLARIFLFKS